MLGLAFSGGKDSLACWYLYRDQNPIVLWVNTGKIQAPESGGQDGANDRNDQAPSVWPSKSKASEKVFHVTPPAPCQ